MIDDENWLIPNYKILYKTVIQHFAIWKQVTWDQYIQNVFLCVLIYIIFPASFGYTIELGYIWSCQLVSSDMWDLLLDKTIYLDNFKMLEI